MASSSVNQFNALWEKSLKEPQTKVAAVEKVELEITVSDVLNGIQGMADSALRQKTLKKPDYDELVGHLGNLKKVVARVDEKVLLKAVTTAPPTQ